MDMRVTQISGVPHLPAILVTFSWNTLCCNHISDKKLCSFRPPPLPRVNFFASDMKTRKSQHWKEKIPLLFWLMWRGDEYCSLRHIKLGHPVLYPYSDKKLCSLLPPRAFLLLTRNNNNNNNNNNKLYFHDHKGIIVLQKLLI